MLLILIMQVACHFLSSNLQALRTFKKPKLFISGFLFLFQIASLRQFLYSFFQLEQTAEMGRNHVFSTLNWPSALYKNNESGVQSDQVFDIKCINSDSVKVRIFNVNRFLLHTLIGHK